MHISQRQCVLGFLSLLALVALLVLALEFVAGESVLQLASITFALLIIFIMGYAYWHGWEYARHCTVAIITLLTAVTLQEPFLTERFSLASTIPPVLALVFTGPLWVLGSAIVVLGSLIFRAHGQGVYANPFTILLYSLLVGGMIIARLVLETTNRIANNARMTAEATAHELAQANVNLETRVAERTAELQATVDRLEASQMTIRMVGAPILPVIPGVLVAPLMGALDSERIAHLTTKLLQEVQQRRAHHVILDITAIVMVDRGVVQALFKVVGAVQLLGAQVSLAGIRAEVAQQIVTLQIDVGSVSIYPHLQEAIQQLIHTAPLVAIGAANRAA